MTPYAVILLQPALPPWLIGFVLLILAVAGWYTYTRCALSLQHRIALWALRLASSVVLAWLVLQPRRRTVTHTQEAPLLALAVDASVSMTEELEGVVVSRWEKAVEFLDDSKVKSRTKRYRTVRYELGADVRESTASPEEIRFNAPRSHLGAGINDVVDKHRGSDLAAIVLLSDGLDQSGAELTAEAKAVPIFIPELERPLTKGASSRGPDVWIGDVSYPKMTVANWKTGIDVLVRRNGNGKASVPIHFYQETQRQRTSVVQFAENEQFKQISFEIEPVEVGRILYRVEIVPEADSDKDNNDRQFLIEVTDPKNRVLYLEGPPRWEFKFLKRALFSEKNYELAAYVQGGDGSFINFSEAEGSARGDVPAMTPDGLSTYRVVILGDLVASALQEEDWANLRSFVEKGGGILMVGAKRALGAEGWHTVQAMQDLLPATPEPGSRMNEGRFSVDMTPSGRAHPALRSFQVDSALPPVLSFFGPVKVGEFSSTLVAGLDGSPILVVRRYGQGRVAMVLSDSLWRWQMGSSATGGEKNLYNRFVTQVVYWLAPSQKEVEKTDILQIMTAKSEAEVRELVTIGAVYGEAKEDAEALNCAITTPDGRRQMLPMVRTVLAEDVGLAKKANGFKCTFRPQTPGKYEAAVSTPDGTQRSTLLLLVTEAERERTGDPINREYLSGLAAQTGGKFVPWKERYTIFADMPYETRDLESVREYPLWNRYWWLLVLIFLFTAEWWWRRRLDLV